MRHKLQYLFWGLVSNNALKLYYAAPRELLQDELFLLHRYALKKAHNARMKGERKKHWPDCAANYGGDCDMGPECGKET